MFFISNIKFYIKMIEETYLNIFLLPSELNTDIKKI